MQVQRCFGILLTCFFMLWSGQSLSDSPRFSISLYGGTTHESIDVPTQPGVSVSSKGTPAFGLGVGYAFNENLGLEFDLVRGGVDVTASGPRGTVSDELEANTMGLYLTQRTSGNIYLKLKLGVVRQELDSTLRNETSDTGSSYGIGAGYKLSQNLSLEAEYVRFDRDVGWVLASGRFSFL